MPKKQFAFRPGTTTEESPLTGAWSTAIFHCHPSGFATGGRENQCMRSTRHSSRTLSTQGIIPQGRDEAHPIQLSVSLLEVDFVCPLQTDVFHLPKEQGIPSPPVQWSMTAELKQIARTTKVDFVRVGPRCFGLL